MNLVSTGLSSPLHIAFDDPLRPDDTRLAAVPEVYGLGTSAWNVQTGALQIDELWAKILGYTVAELGPLSNQAQLDLIRRDDQLRVTEAWDRHFSGETEFCECEYRMRHRNGRWVWVMCRGRVMTRTLDGRPEWLQSLLRDITERRQREELIRKSGALLDHIGEIAGIGAWEADLVSNALFWSTKTRDIHGVPADFQPTLETAVEFYAPEAREVIGGAVAQARVVGTPWDLELPLIRADGRRIWVRTVGAVIFEDGKAVRLAGALQDITARVTTQHALQDANERLRLATDAGGVGIWDWDVVNNRLVWDARMYELYGTLPRDEKPTLELWTGHLHPDNNAAIRQVLQDGLFESEFRVVWDDGSVHDIRGAGLVIRDTAGHPLRMIGVNWDITAQKLIEAERIERVRERMAASAELERMAIEARAATERARLVKRQTDRFGAAIEAIQGVLWTNDATGHMVGEQPGWAALTGQDLQEYQDYGWAHAIHPDDAQPTVDAWNQAVAERRTFEFEHRVRRYDGCWRTFAIRAVPLFDPEDGSLREWVGVHTDITEQREAETALRESNAELDRAAEEFRALADGMADLCWMAHPNGHVYWYNRRWYEYTGKTAAAMEGWGWQSVHDPTALAAVLERWQASIATGVAFEMTFPLRDANGEFQPFLTRVVPVHGPDGKVRRWLGTNVNVSELRDLNAELEQLAGHLAKARDVAERASRAKTRFLAGMSHELRTPLNGILGYAEMLRLEGDLNPLQQTRLEAMLGAGNHLLDMITSVLNMSEIESGHVTLQITNVDVSEMMGGCLNVIGAAAEAKGLSLSLTTMRGTPGVLTTDPTRLRQVVLNLLGNAVKFTSQGSIELRLRLPVGGNGIRIEVADTGPGIPADLRARLFQDFERLESRVAATVEGSGLGLALSARLAALLAGRIGHDDKPGGGSVFWLELPPTIAGAPSPGKTTASIKPALEAAVQPLRVLVVDDVAMNRDIMQSFLSSANHLVTCVDGGAKAIAAAANVDYDVILMDVSMPEVDGLEATRRIRRLSGRRGRTHIIGVTAQAFAEQVADCKKAGMDAHLSKPFSPEALLQAVARAAATVNVSARDVSPTHASTAPSNTVTTFGSEWPVFEQAQAEELANFLSPDRLTTALETIVERCEILRRRLGEQQTGIHSGSEIVEEVHKLAGTAGMFGFARLAEIGRRFEYAVDTCVEEVPALTVNLRTAIEATVENIRLRQNFAQ